MEETKATGFRATSEQWQVLLGEFSTSGKSARCFSREKGIPHNQMRYRIQRERNKQKKHGFIELIQESSPGNLWVEAGVCRIHVRRGFDAELLKQVAEALS